jgi:putative oxidoreductase
MTTTPAPVTVARSVTASVVVWALQVALGLLYLMAGLGKLSGMPEMVALFRAIGAGQWLRYAVGAAETAGGIGLFIPKLSGLAALALVPVMFGAIVTSIIVPHESILAPTVTLAGILVLAWLRRGETLEIARVVSRLL